MTCHSERSEESRISPLLLPSPLPSPSPLSLLSSLSLPSPKNPSKLLCQAPARPKNPLTSAPSTTSTLKILGKVVSLRLVESNHRLKSSDRLRTEFSAGPVAESKQASAPGQQDRLARGSSSVKITTPSPGPQSSSPRSLALCRLCNQPQCDESLSAISGLRTRPRRARICSNKPNRHQCPESLLRCTKPRAKDPLYTSLGRSPRLHCATNQRAEGPTYTNFRLRTLSIIAPNRRLRAKATRIMPHKYKRV